MSLSIFNLITDMWTFLHCSGPTDSPWFTDAQITIEFNDHFRHLCQNTGLNIQRDTTTITLVNGQPLYDLPADYLSGLAFAYQGNPLRVSSTIELERLDPSLSRIATPQYPLRYVYLDKQGVGVVGFYPVPGPNEDGQQVEVIFHQSICNLDTAHTMTEVNLPQVFGDWAEFQVAADLYKIESPFRAVDISEGMQGMATLYFSLFQKLYGTAQ